MSDVLLSQEDEKKEVKSVVRKRVSPKKKDDSFDGSEIVPLARNRKNMDQESNNNDDAINTELEPSHRSSGSSNANRKRPRNNNNNNNGNGRGNSSKKPFDMSMLETPEEPGAEVPRLDMEALARMNIVELRAEAIRLEIDDPELVVKKRQEIISRILSQHIENDGVVFTEGTLELRPDTGYGFLRSSHNSYLKDQDDVYISPKQVRMFGLKTGDTLYGMVRIPKEKERYFAMSQIYKVNGLDPREALNRVSFESLVPIFPDERLNLESDKSKDISTRIINLFCPIGMGQRSLIVAPPRTGKTIILQKIANVITENYPDVHLIVLLIDERPEEVTDMRRNVKGEIVASTFDELAIRHVQVAEMVIEKAKRLVEHKKDVVILLDSITRLARAYNQSAPASGKILSGGVDSNALHKPKRFLGAARNIENGGSLTIIASALVETGSRMDEVIFEEFKGTGNMELVLDRKMAEKRIFPSINIKKSGTRKEDLLLTNDELNKIWVLRNFLNPMDDGDATGVVLDNMRKTKDNEGFLKSMNNS